MPVMSRIEQTFCRSLPWRRITSRVVVPWVLEGQTLDGEVLELGSGSGAMAADLLARFPTVRLTATDLDARMLESASRQLSRYGDRATVELVDSTALPYPDARFDAVVSFIMLHHVIDWETAVGEAVRVLRPGGVLVGYDLVQSVPARLLHRLDGSPHRLAAPDEIFARLRSLDIDELRVSPGFGGLVARFRARRRADSAEPLPL